MRWALLGTLLLLASGVLPAAAQTPPSTGAPSTTAVPPERTIRVAVVVLDPFVVKRGIGYSGFSVELWDVIARRNNYRTVFVEEPSIQEQLAAVRAGAADVALGNVTITAERATTFDFTEPTLNSGLQIMVKQGQANAVSGLWRAVTDQAVLVLIVLMALTAAVAAIVIWLLERRRNPDFAHHVTKGVGEGGWWAAVTMLTVGYGDRVPRTGAGRAFSVLWMVFGMLLVAAVTATFTANLTVHRLNTVIDNPDDLRDHRVVTVKDSTASAYLDRNRIPFRPVSSTDEMIAEVRGGQSDAAVFDAPVLARAVHESGGNLALTGPQFTHSYDGIAVALGSDLRQPINQALLVANDDGTYDHIYNSWFAT